MDRWPLTGQRSIVNCASIILARVLTKSIGPAYDGVAKKFDVESLITLDFLDNCPVYVQRFFNRFLGGWTLMSSSRYFILTTVKEKIKHLRILLEIYKKVPPLAKYDN